MKTLNAITKRECSARQCAAGRYNPGRIAHFTNRWKKFIAELPNGSSDDAYFFREGNTIYALSVNRSFGYCGLTEYDADPSLCNKDEHSNRLLASEGSSVFLQYDHEIESALGKRGLDLSPLTIAKRLVGIPMKAFQLPLKQCAQTV